MEQKLTRYLLHTKIYEEDKEMVFKEQQVHKPQYHKVQCDSSALESQRTSFFS